MFTVLLVTLHTARAQYVPNGDFSLGTSGWTDASTLTQYLGILGYDTQDVQVLSVSGMAWVSPPYTLPLPYNGVYPSLAVSVTSEPFLVTRTTFAYAWTAYTLDGFSVTLVDPLSGQTLANRYGVDGPTAAGLERRLVDTAAACGEVAIARIGAGASSGDPNWGFDDLELVGDLCPAFADPDGDGLCTGGVDLDADGDCEDATEWTSYTSDCDEGNAAVGACLVVGPHEPAIDVHTPYRFPVTGAEPGETVELVASTVPGSTCAPVPAGNLCVGLGAPIRVVDSQIADAAGAVTLTARTARLQPFTTVYLQAVAVRHRGSVATDVVPLPVHARVGPPADPGIVNGDFEDGLHGWARLTDVYGNTGAFDTDLEPCPSAETVPTTSRGAALHTDFHPGWGGVLGVVDCVSGSVSWPVRVTHEALGWAVAGVDPAALEVHDAVTGATVPIVPVSSPAADGFVDAVADLSATCGEQVVIQLSAVDADWDDVRLLGPPCPGYRDPDGDGQCPLGVDLDGDRACVSAGEPDTAPPPPLIPVVEAFEDFEAPTAVVTGGVRFAYSDTPWVTPLGDWGWSSPAARWNPLYDPAVSRLVTHDTVLVSLAQAGVEDWRNTAVQLRLEGGASPGASNETVYAEVSGADLSPGTWFQIAVPDLCGSWVTSVDIGPLEPMYYAATDLLFLDDLGIGGPTCAQFVDLDGDGACPEGLDLDLDGECVGDGEPTPGVVQDLSEGAP